MEINQREHRDYHVTEEDTIHFFQSSNGRKIIFFDSIGRGITLNMSQETFDYIRKKMNRLALSISQKEKSEIKKKQAEIKDMGFLNPEDAWDDPRVAMDVEEKE